MPTDVSRGDREAVCLDRGAGTCMQTGLTCRVPMRQKLWDSALRNVCSVSYVINFSDAAQRGRKVLFTFTFPSRWFKLAELSVHMTDHVSRDVNCHGEFRRRRPRVTELFGISLILCAVGRGLCVNEWLAFDPMIGMCDGFLHSVSTSLSRSRAARPSNATDSWNFFFLELVIELPNRPVPHVSVLDAGAHSLFPRVQLRWPIDWG